MCCSWSWDRCRDIRNDVVGKPNTSNNSFGCDISSVTTRFTYISIRLFRNRTYENVIIQEGTEGFFNKLFCDEYVEWTQHLRDVSGNWY
jgi:hypothetical protein